MGSLLGPLGLLGTFQASVCQTHCQRLSESGARDAQSGKRLVAILKWWRQHDSEVIGVLPTAPSQHAAQCSQRHRMTPGYSHDLILSRGATQPSCPAVCLFFTQLTMVQHYIQTLPSVPKPMFPRLRL